MDLMTTHPFDDDHLNEECAVFGIYGTKEASINTALGLHALQHRGQEASGIVSFDGKTFHARRGFGHVGENFGAGSGIIDALGGHVSIGHNRYSTSGNSNAILEIQPFSSELAFGGFALGSDCLGLTRCQTIRTQAGIGQIKPGLHVGQMRAPTCPPRPGWPTDKLCPAFLASQFFRHICHPFVGQYNRFQIRLAQTGIKNQHECDLS